MKSQTTPFLCSALAAACIAFAANQTTAQSIAADNPALVGFASEVVDYSPAPGLAASVSNPNAALGAPDSTVASLSDPLPGVTAGSITLGFDQAITNGVGDDFAVFENGFLSSADPAFVFAELAFVEVSTNGNDFARFPTISLNTLPDVSNPLDSDLDLTFGRAFASLRRSNVDGFAGADIAGQGTLFDLEALVNDALVTSNLVNLQEINFVRLVDVPGDGREIDSLGNPIFDSFDPFDPSAPPRQFAFTGGFDLAAVGVLNQVPEPGSAVALAGLAGLAMLRRRSR